MRKRTTRIIGSKEFRENFSKILDEAQKKNVHFIVMRHSEILANVTPPTKKDEALEQLAAEIAEAREQVKRGEVYTEEELAKEFGIDL